MLGAPEDATTDLGPLSSAAHREKVAAAVESAVRDGARMLCGGRPRRGPGFFYEPTIVSNIKEGVRLWDEEQFGPVLPITPYTDDDEAVRRANDTEFGLGGSVWSSDTAAGNELASKILSGTVWVNAHSE